MKNNEIVAYNLLDLARMLDIAGAEILLLAEATKQSEDEVPTFNLNESTKGLLRGVAADLLLLTQDTVIINPGRNDLVSR